MAELKALLSFAVPYRAALSAGTVLMMLESGAALAVPWLGGRLAELVLQEHGSSLCSIQAALAGLLALFAVQALLKFGNTYLLGRTSERIVADMKIRVCDHL